MLFVLAPALSQCLQSSMAIALPEQFRELLKAMGSYGGRARAQKYSKEQLSEWGKTRWTAEETELEI